MMFETSRTVLASVLCLVVLSACSTSGSQNHSSESRQPTESAPLVIHYLEIVTSEVDETCSALEATRGVQFREPDPMLGNARTAGLQGGGMIGVRAPMRESEAPTVRPYLLVEDIEAALKIAQAAGGEVAHPPFETPGRGKFAIYFLGGIEHGLWQL